MKNMKILVGQGAEAVLTRENNVLLKDRVAKKYRIKEIDEKVRKSRTKVEASLLRRAQRAGVRVPKVLDEKVENGEFLIKMEFIQGPKVRDILESDVSMALEIGSAIAKLHENDIIHGDLTTSNMIWSDGLVLIDFGLGFTSKKVEDKAVDLYLLRQALESTHSVVADSVWVKVLDAYLANNGEKEVLTRIDDIDKRGRYKGKH